MNIIPYLKNNRFVVVLSLHSAKEYIPTLIAELALRGPVTVLDAGNQFQAYRIVQLIRLRSLHVDDIAKRIAVRRAFTCYQTVSLLAETPAQPHPYVILDLLASFYDDQVSILECRRLLTICIKEIERLSFTAPVVLDLPPIRVEAKSFLMDELCRRADEVFILETLPAIQEKQLALF
ncbi:MAG TPA: hypothetical protein PKJ84_00095 [Anaerolineales bacterium]|nr:hypothetical protein [Anaerolineales bacterium]HNM35808.1 hypothetical protein [Anaerolineales bacterium]HNO92536.1 hypothetical protein [Anaerolineales bacterium]